MVIILYVHLYSMIGPMAMAKKNGGPTWAAVKSALKDEEELTGKRTVVDHAGLWQDGKTAAVVDKSLLEVPTAKRFISFVLLVIGDPSAFRTGCRRIYVHGWRHFALERNRIRLLRSSGFLPCLPLLLLLLFLLLLLILLLFFQLLLQPCPFVRTAWNQPLLLRAGEGTGSFGDGGFCAVSLRKRRRNLSSFHHLSSSSGVWRQRFRKLKCFRENAFKELKIIKMKCRRNKDY